jgi:hypothetical protein
MAPWQSAALPESRPENRSAKLVGGARFNVKTIDISKTNFSEGDAIDKAALLAGGVIRERGVVLANGHQAYIDWTGRSDGSYYGVVHEIQPKQPDGQSIQNWKANPKYAVAVSASSAQTINNWEANPNNPDRNRPITRLNQGGPVGNPTPPPRVPVRNPSDYDWNLPPHKWSMPLFPQSNHMFAEGRSSVLPDDRYRRGRLWWKANDQHAQVIDADGNVVNAVVDKSRQVGFQFLWNPETISTSVAIQMDATPTNSDRLIGVAGAFPATESMTINVHIDRTNDFACANALLGRPSRLEPLVTSKGRLTSEAYIGAPQTSQFVEFYKNSSGFVGTNAKIISEKLKDLFERGTISDIDYLYKTINGVGPGGKDAAGKVTKWINGRGIASADIGYLMPTLINIDIGPMSYQGFVNSLTVTHTAFTQDMIPIRSDLAIGLNLMATSGLTSQAARKNG